MGDLTTWQVIGLTLGSGTLGLLLVALVGWLYIRLRDNEQGYPGEEQIEEALLPVVHFSIMAAYRWSEGVLDQFGERLDGVDKAKLAAHVYELLPEHIKIGDKTFPLHIIKMIIPQDAFERLVQRAFDEFAVQFEELRDKYGDKLDELLGGESGDADAVVRSLAH